MQFFSYCFYRFQAQTKYIAAIFTYSVFSNTLHNKVQERIIRRLSFKVTYFVVLHVESMSPDVSNPQIVAVFQVYGLKSCLTKIRSQISVQKFLLVQPNWSLVKLIQKYAGSASKMRVSTLLCMLFRLFL